MSEGETELTRVNAYSGIVFSAAKMALFKEVSPAEEQCLTVRGGNEVLKKVIYGRGIKCLTVR